MINKLKFKINFARVTTHQPEWDMEEMIVEAYNKNGALKIFHDKMKGYLIPYDSIKVEEMNIEKGKTYKYDAK